MADTTFVSGTLIESPWLNDVNDHVYHGTHETNNENVLVNGGFDVWQRGTSFVPATLAYIADHWRTASNSAGTFAFTQQTTGVADNLQTKRYLRMANTGAADTLWIDQSVEWNTFSLFRGQSMTVSVWLRKGSALTADVQLSLSSSLNEGDQALVPGATTVLIPNASLSSTVFTQFSATYAVPADTTHRGAYIRINTLSQAGAANVYLDVAQVKLEAGTTVGEWQPVEPAVELVKCQRFYQKSFPYDTVPAQNAGNAGEVMWTVPVAGAVATVSPRVYYKTTMRVAPTVTLYNPAAANAFTYNLTKATSGSASAAEGNSKSEDGFNVAVTGDAGWAVGDVLGVHYVASAEF